MYRFHPQWDKARELVNDGSIGQLRSIHSHFSYNNHEPENIRNNADMGGGALMDIGCYSISLSRYLFNSEPLRVMGQITPYAGYEVDCFVSGVMEFADGSATFTAATKMESDQYVKASGEAGSLLLNMPFSPESDAETTVILKRNSQVESLRISGADHDRNMADAFALSIRNNQPVPTPLGDALANMKIIDAIFASVKTGQWIEVNP
jgi:predicted dehydrogenase